MWQRSQHQQGRSLKRNKHQEVPKRKVLRRLMKSKMKAVISKIHQEQTLPKEPKKAKVKMVNLSAPSDMEIETETSAETDT